MQARRSELGVADRVKLLGHVTGARRNTQRSACRDVFVSTSQHEGFGLVFLEAMAFGLPVVCYDRGGQVDFLSTPTTGTVIKLNDIDAFTQAVLDLHRSPERRAAIRQHNLAAVENLLHRSLRAALRSRSSSRRSSLARASSRPPARNSAPMGGLVGILGEGSVAELESMAARMAYRGQVRTW